MTEALLSPLLPEHALQRFMTEKSLEAFLELRRAVQHCGHYQPDDNAMEVLGDLMQRQAHAEAAQFIAGLMPNWLTNPGVHQAAAYALHKEGDIRTARFKAFVADSLLEGIMMTGDGSRARPWLVMRTEDEYDVLMHLEKQPVGQELVRDGARAVDVISCEDGTLVHFDVGLPLSALPDARSANDDPI
jgi:hypothetical protein